MGHDGLPKASPRGEFAGDRRPRVLSVPHRRPYVQGVIDVDDVELLGAPAVPTMGTRGAATPGTASAALDPSWVAEHHTSFDVLHLHAGLRGGGLEATDPCSLRELVGVLREHGRRLVVTVHALRHPGLLDDDAYEAALDAVVPAADHVLTLTHAVAACVRRRWGRAAEVLPHPCVVAPDAMARLRAPWVRRSGRLGIHLGDVPPNADVAPVLLAAERVVTSEPRTALDVRIHNGAWDRHDRLRERLHRLARRADVEVYVHDRLSDEALNGWLGSLQVLVLPHRHGTHTSWIERCKDVATAVVAPRVGGYVEQGATATFPADGDRLGADDVLAAVRGALDATPPHPRPAQRQVERADVRRAHTRLYRHLAGLPAACTPELVVLDEPTAPGATPTRGPRPVAMSVGDAATVRSGRRAG